MVKNMAPDWNQKPMNERIISVAKKLFAQKGYQSVTTREIAEKLGINISTFHYHTGGKSNLYQAVLESLYSDELSAISLPVEQFPAADYKNKQKVQEALTRSLDGFLDIMLQDPDRAHLYVRRWLEWPDEFMEVEVKLTLKTFRPLKKFLEHSMKAGSIRKVSISVFLRSFLWMQYGYFITGIIDWKTWVSDPFKKKNLDTFREYLREYLDSMLFRVD
jgi:AcrR family transcriptional regulator